MNAQIKNENNDIEFTGERLIINKYVKKNFDEVLDKHIKRYEFASLYTNNMNILDAACGSGYGTKMLKEAGARLVTGVDICEESISNAKELYGGKDISFLVSDINKTDFQDKTFDSIVSFETIEHIDSGIIWINEAYRILNDNGLFIVSTPNRLIYDHLKDFNDKVRNSYHKFEYDLSEFLGELLTRFDIIELYGQTFIPNRVLTSHFTNFKILNYYFKHFINTSNDYEKNFKRIKLFIINSLRNRKKHKLNIKNIRTKSKINNTGHEIISLSSIKNMQPTVIIAICRKK